MKKMTKHLVTFFWPEQPTVLPVTEVIWNAGNLKRATRIARDHAVRIYPGSGYMVKLVKE